jgi:hypothetical protein
MTRLSYALCFIALAAAAAILLHSPVHAADPPASPLAAVLEQFASPKVPVRGPAEAEPIPHNWPDPTAEIHRPGLGLAQHPMLFAGEGYNTLFVVNHGRVTWTYSFGKGGEIDDVWMMSNGNILCARQFHVEEITPRKEVVWHYEPPEGTEVHTCQPIGLDKVMLVQNALPPKLMIIDKKSGKVETEHDLPAESLTDPRTVHPQFRRARVTAAGTYLLPFLRMHRVAEFDKNFKEIWSCEIPTPWAAVRLQNGNTMIADEHDKLVREVNSKCETVWEVKQSDLPADILLHNIQTADRLANGNTVIFSSTGGTKPEDRPNIIQAVEVTPDKKVVWVLQDWKNLGPSTTAQFLDEPGIPEKPGAVGH